MKRAFILLLILVCVRAVTAQEPEIPKFLRNTLNSEFGSWKMAEIEQSISTYFKEKPGNQSPNFIKGDWNGDGMVDYALLVQRKSDSQKKMVLVFVKDRRGFKRFFLEGFDCLMLVKKGNTDYDFEAKKKFTHKNDAIMSYIWEKSGTSYIWEKNRFRAVLISD